jgi:hypothetical protein
MMAFRIKANPDDDDVSSVEAHVVGRGILDLIDDVFWHLPFSCVRQAKLVRQDNNLPEQAWQARCGLIRAEHRLPNALEELARLWKEGTDPCEDRVRMMTGSAAGSGGDAGGSDAALPYEDD